MIGGSICGSPRPGQHSLCWLVVLVALLLPSGFSPVSAQGVGDLCVVRVKKDDLGPGERGQPYRLGRSVHVMPGPDWPLLFRYEIEPSIWRIDETRTLVPMSGAWPRLVGSLFVRFAAGDRPGRVVGVGFDGIYSLDPGTFEFRRIVAYPRELGWTFTNVVRIERLDKTIVVSSQGLFAVEGDTLVPFEGSPGHGVVNLVDLPSIGGLFWAGAGGGYIRWDDGRVERVVESDESDPPAARELPAANKVIYFFSWRTLSASVDRSAGTPRVAKPEVVWSVKPATKAERPRTLTSRALEAYLFKPFGTNGPLMRLTRDGVEPVPGQTFTMGVPSYMWELASVGLVAIQSSDDLLLFDGGEVSRLPISESDRSGVARFVDFPSVGRAFLFGKGADKEIMRDKTLKEAGRPFAADDHLNWSAEMPSSRIGVLFRESGVYGVGPSGDIAPIPGGSGVSRGMPTYPSSFLSATGSLLFTSSSGMHMIVDRRRTGDARCQ